MKYELWQMSRFGPGEMLTPLVLIDKKETFEEIYNQFQNHIKKGPCAIVLNTNPLEKDKK